ncbi:MAG: hypothetical protein WDM80_01595 [Limisphaerales bacterium]
MSQGAKKPSEKKPISEAVSQFAQTISISQKEDSKYQEEKRFAELVGQKDKRGFWQSAFSIFKRRTDFDDLGYRQTVTPEELLLYIKHKDAYQNLLEKQDTHSFRKGFLVALFVLICIWLGVVIYFVSQNAKCPTVADREKLIQIQNQIVSMALDKTNAVDDAMLKIASPKFSENFFHLSDSVLIAFITSTTVAVLGLFLTAANWLFNKRVTQKSSLRSKKGRLESEEDEIG